MVATVEARTTQASVQGVVQTDTDVRTTSLTVMGVAAVSTPESRTTQESVLAVTQSDTPVRTSQLSVLAVVRGAIENPKLAGWWFTLDGHDFYVLNLGTSGKTLVFDLSTGQWSWWSSGNTPRWRAKIGMNWRSAGKLPALYGSNVIVGDDTYGILWVLDPRKGTDDDTDGLTQLSYPRVATGQMISRSRQFEPVYSVSLTASLGQPALTANQVTLSYSDDMGQTYVVADSPQTVVSGNYNQEFRWLSLGLVKAPGRLFKLEDDGSFARIDGLNVNE